MRRRATPPIALAVLALVAGSCGRPSAPSPATAAPGLSSSPSPSPGVGRIVLLGASPTSGATIPLEYPGATSEVRLRFGVTVDHALPAGVAVELVLLGAQGDRRGFDFGNSQVLAPGQQAVFESTFLVLEHDLPFSIAAVRAIVIGDEAGRPHLLEADFPLAYTFVERAPRSQTPTAPRITFMRWDAPGPTGGDCPLEGEVVTLDCHVMDDDGDALDMTLRFDNLGPGVLEGAPQATRSFPASPYERTLSHRVVMRTATNGRVTCTVVDAHGNAVTSELAFPCGPR